MTAHFLLTILTPTYNRAHLLPNCYRSLIQQTDQDFEWIIVDDGSTDDTQATVSSFPKSPFPIRYLRKENGGKHTALNYALPHIRGSYVLILDSDDTLTADAVSAVRAAWQRYAQNPKIGVVTFLRGRSDQEPLCLGTIENRAVDQLRFRRKKIHSSDCCEVIRTEIMRMFPFPVFDWERFLSEGALWNRVSVNYQWVYINRVIYLCQYLEGGLTKSGRGMRIRNPKGGMYASMLTMHPRVRIFRRIKSGFLYCCYGFFAGMSAGNLLSGADYKALVSLCLLPGWLLYGYWKRKYPGRSV